LPSVPFVRPNGGMGSGSGSDPRIPTAPPPFDPEQYARNSELVLRAAKPDDARSTDELPAAPPLNKRVRMKVPPADLAWFELSDVARALAARIDGTTTLFEILEAAAMTDGLAAVAQLHDNDLLVYEE
jgi:hypothetical protein